MKNFFFLHFLTFFFFLHLVSAAQGGKFQADSLKAVELYRKAVEFARNDDPEGALRFYEESLEYRKKIYGEVHSRLGGVYLGMGIQYKNLHQLDRALEYYQIAEKMYLHDLSPDAPPLGDVYTNIGNYYREKGNYAEAIRYHERAIAIYNQSSDERDKNNLGSITYNLANSIHLANREQEALELALKNFQNAPFSLQNRYLNLLASIYTALGDFPKAQKIHQQVIRNLKIRYGLEDYGLADQYVGYSQLFIRMLQPDSALSYLHQAEPIYLQYGQAATKDLGELYQTLGNVYSSKIINSGNFEVFRSNKTKNLVEAINYYLKSVEILNNNVPFSQLTYQAFESCTDRIICLWAMQNMGNAYLQLAELSAEDKDPEKVENLKQAVRAFSTASELVQFMRTGFISEESKLLFSELQQNVFLRVVEAAYELFRLTRETAYFELAFENAERNKAASLFDNISESEAREFSLVPDSLTQLENRYNSSLAYYREKLYSETHSDEPDSARVAGYEAQIFSYEQKRNELRAFLEKNFSEYYSMKYEQKKLYLKDIQKKLGRNEVLLEYVLDSGRPAEDSGYVYVFAVSKDDFRLLRSPLTKETSRQIQEVHHFLSTPSFLSMGKKEFAGYCHNSFQLYRKFLSPFEDLISEKKMVVVPDGELNYLPFEALLTEMPDTGYIQFNKLPYLIMKYPVNYSYSAGLFLAANKQSPTVRKRVLAFAPSYPPSASPDPSIRLVTIPGIFDEVAYIARKFNTTTFSDEQATENHFRKMAGQFDILHLAMHTIINDSVPLFSRLAFYPGNPDSLQNDGWLNTSDIYNLKLHARMAVLSACNTGTGTLRKGEGVMSLARGFLYAGCPAIVMTLWEVEDRTGTEIMKEFYKNIRNGKPKDVALRSAKIKHIQEADPLKAHPHFWLGYITIGKTDPLFMGNEVYFFGVIVLFFLLLFADQLYKKLARKKSGQK